MGDFVSSITALPVIGRCAVIGVLVLALPGAVVGLIVGLAANPPTAWFAVFELGVPLGLLGGLLGLIVGTVVHLTTRWADGQVRRR